MARRRRAVIPLDVATARHLGPGGGGARPLEPLRRPALGVECPGPAGREIGVELGWLRPPEPAAHRAALLAVPGGPGPQLPRAQEKRRAEALHAPLARFARSAHSTPRPWRPLGPRPLFPVS